MSNIGALIQLTKAITKAGGTNPKAVTDLLATWDAACAAADNLGGGTLLDQLNTGKLNAKTAATLVPDTANRATAHATAVEQVRDLAPHIVRAAAQAFRGQAGEELINSLRPAFDAAAAGIANTPFSPDTARNPGQVITLGDEAVQALRLLPTHAHTLDTIYRSILYKLVLDIDVLPDHGWGLPESRFMPFVIDANHKGDIRGAAQTYNSAAGTGEPGGGWHRLHAAGYKVRLNTPAEATALADDYNAAIVTDSQRHAKLEAEATAALRDRTAGINQARALADSKR